MEEGQNGSASSASGGGDDWMGAFMDAIPADSNTNSGQSAQQGEGNSEESGNGEGEGQGEGQQEGSAAQPIQITPEQFAQLQQLQQFAPLVELMVQGGFSSADAVQAKLAADNEQAQLQQDYTTRTDQVFNNLNAQVQNGALTPEQAEDLYNRECELIKREILANHSLLKAERGTMNQQLAAVIEKHPALKEAGPVAHQMILQLHGVSRKPLDEVAGTINQILTQAATNAVTAHEQKRTQNRQAPAPQGGGKPTPPQGGGKGGDDRDWSDVLGIKF